MKDWPSGTTKNCPAEPAAVPRPSAQERLSSGIRRAKAASTMAKDKRSEEHTSELQSLMRISYAVFCLKKKKKTKNHSTISAHHTTDRQHASIHCLNT